MGKKYTVPSVTAAIVTKDVEPYSVVGGNPARFMKKRFDDELIKLLLNVKWWDFEPDKLVEFLPTLCDADLDSVQNRLRTILSDM